MIKILERRKPFQCGGLYDLKTDSGKPILVHTKSKRSIPVTMEMLRRLKHEYVQDDNYAM